MESPRAGPQPSDLFGASGLTPLDELSLDEALARSLLEQVPELDAVLVAIGGGGLMAGVACAVKALRP